MENLLIVNRENIPTFLSLKVAPSADLLELWNMLSGIDSEKSKLLTHMTLSIEPKELLSWYHSTYGIATDKLHTFRKTALFLGPSGTGKTTLANASAHALSERMKEKVFLVKLGLVRSKFVGQTSKNIETAFKQVKEWSKDHIVVLLLDEFDSLANKRDFGQMHEDIRDAVNTLIKELDSLSPHRVFIIACSNLEGNLDEAVLRRFSEGIILRFRRPNKHERFAFLQRLLEPYETNPYELAMVTKKTQNRTQCDLVCIVDTAIRYAYEENTRLQLRHLQRAIAELRPTGDYS